MPPGRRAFWTAYVTELEQQTRALSEVDRRTALTTLSAHLRVVQGLHE